MNRISKCMVLLILLSSMATLCYAQSQSDPGQNIGIDDAEKSLRTFLSSIDSEKSFDEVIISSGYFRTSSDDYYEFETGKGNFKVDKKTGVVESAWFYQDDSDSGRSEMSESRSLKLAEEFARRHYLSFDSLNMKLSNSEKLEGNNGRTRYLFRWYDVRESLFGQDIYTSNYVFVAVEDGKIAGYIGIERKTEVSLKPAVDEKEAIEKAVYALDLPADSKTDYEYNNRLYVCYFDEEQHLAWDINIDNGVDSWGYASGGQAVIDAHTGEVLLKNPYL